MREKLERENKDKKRKRDERRIIMTQGPTPKNPHLLISEKMKLGSEIDGGFNDHHNQLLSTTLKFKLPKKIFSDSSTSVPRKLRSAIRKRSCESSSVSLSDAKGSNNRVNCVDSLRRDSYKKFKQNGWSDHSQRQTDSLAISKDEEEVAETLFALAGMIPLNAIPKDKKTGNGSFEEKSVILSGKQCSTSRPSSEDTTVILKEESETVISSPNGLSERRPPNLDFKVSVPPTVFQIPPLLRACDSTDQNRENMLSERKPEIYQLHKRESHINIGVAGDLIPANEDINNALASKLLPDPGGDGLSLRPSWISFPSWPHNSTSSTSGSFKDAPTGSKVSCSIIDGRKSWKRCIAHVCISHLIQGLQTSAGKDILPLGTNQIRPLQCPASENKDNLTETLAAGYEFGPGVHKVANFQVKEDGSSTSCCGDSNKQSYNFLSLSTGVGAEINNGANRMGMTLGAKGNVLQLNSVGQHSAYVPCSMPQNRFPSIPYRDQASIISGTPSPIPPQVNLQLPPYFGNPCGPAHIGVTRSTQHPPSNQQQIWSAHLAAQFRSGPFLSSHITNWKNGTRESHSSNQIQAPRPSQEMMGAKFLHTSQQPQQQLFGLCQSIPSMSSQKPQHGQQPSICEDKGGRFHPDGVLPLQLLCNERLLS